MCFGNIPYKGASGSMPSILMEPISIKGMELRNRIIMPAMCTEFATSAGFVTERLIEHYVSRAKGGTGLIIVEASYVDPLGKAYPHMLGISDDKFVPGLQDLAAAVHAAGSKIAIQLLHGGRRSLPEEIGTIPVAPSPVPALGMVTPRELSVAEIEDIVKAFAEAAARAKGAGFDAVEVHLAHGYLANQFLSPLSNYRSDQYGGSLENRVRFPVQILKQIRKEVGNDFPILVKVCGSEYIRGGIGIEESQQQVQYFVEAGCDLITVSGGILASGEYIAQPMDIEHGCHVHLAEAIKGAVNVPVAAIGRINSPELAEEILLAGKADAVCMGRALLADPNLSSKIDRGAGNVRPCIACNQGCVDRLYLGVGITCLVNPLVGREHKVAIAKAPKEKKILVAGGGPAGMEAARVAAGRGHQVALYDRNQQLGGLLRLAALPPGKQEIQRLIAFYEMELSRLGVRMEFAAEVDGQVLRRERPDALILATGAEPVLLTVKGKQYLTTAEAVLRNPDMVQRYDRIAVVGGGLVGCETAAFLACYRGAKVKIFEQLDRLAQDTGARHRKPLLARLSDAGVDAITRAKVLEVSNREVWAEVAGIQECYGDFDLIVCAVGYASRQDEHLVAYATAQGISVARAGDCARPRRALEAIREGFDVAVAI